MQQGGDGDPACGGDEDPADEDPAEDLDKDLHLHSAGTRENWCRSKELCIMCGSCDISRERVEGFHGLPGSPGGENKNNHGVLLSKRHTGETAGRR